MSILELLIVIVLVAWLLGVVVAPVGNIIHVLLIIVLVLVVVRVIQGRAL